MTSSSSTASTHPAYATTASEHHAAPAADGPGRRRPSTNTSLLPADDGMSTLRARIHALRSLDLSNEDQARRMHILMNERFALARQVRVAKELQRQQEQRQMAVDQRPQWLSQHGAAERGGRRMLDGHVHGPRTPRSSMDSTAEFERGMLSSATSSPLTPVSSAEDRGDNAYNLSLEDLVASFSPPERRDEGDDEAQGAGECDPEEGPLDLGCAHYKRNVKVQCHDCRRWYPCRQCHDEDQNHRLDRKTTRNMLCMLCWTPQPASGSCSHCGEPAAAYYCEVCKLWENNTSRPVYHCPDCGICRRGEGLGKDFHHCKRCNVCITIQHRDSHRCYERATEGVCPICGDDMFDSPTFAVQMPCGHYLHKLCFQGYMKTAYKCPICKKSAVNMELQWKKLKEAVDSQPMPANFADAKVFVHCNDCSTKSTVPYHWLGNQCAYCDSFNTNELQLNAPSELVHRIDEEVRASGTVTPRDVPPRSPSAAPILGSPHSGSYFLTPERGTVERRNSASSMMSSMRFSPYDVLERFSRSLSPIRNYFGGELPVSEDGLLHSDPDEIDFWGTDGRFLSGGEEEDDEDGRRGTGRSRASNEASSDADSDDSDIQSEEEDDDVDDGFDPIQLIGHL